MSENKARYTVSPAKPTSLPPEPDRWKLRSMTYPGIAEAMAEQWGEL